MRELTETIFVGCNFLGEKNRAGFERTISVRVYRFLQTAPQSLGHLSLDSGLKRWTLRKKQVVLPSTRDAPLDQADAPPRRGS
jgi:hypothetical protein